MKKIFISGIGTDIGKTVVSAILTEALKADYWKPIQSGDIENSDTLKVKELVTNTCSVFHKEAYTFQNPLSPHAAAKLENCSIKLSKIKLPKTKNTLVIEGAGGVLVPLNKNKLIIDLISQLDASVIVVSRNYLGSINHTLLTIQELRRRKIKIIGIIFNGDHTPESEEYITKFTKIKTLLRIENETIIDKKTIEKYSKKINFKF